jgi:hypothetical protein
MIRAMKKQLNSDSGIKCTTVQFHGNSYNSLIRSLDWAKTVRGLSRQAVLPWVKISGQSEFRKASQYLSTEVVRILLFISF